MNLKQKLLVTASGLILLVFSLIFPASISALVLDTPVENGLDEPIMYTFELGSGEGVKFSFESNVTMRANFEEFNATGALINNISISGTSGEYNGRKDFPWNLNVTIIALNSTPIIDVDFKARYTLMRATGIIMSFIIIGGSAVTGIIFVYLLISTRKQEDLAQIEKEVDGDIKE